ncbi:hypothetical protein SCHPADRAFT_282963 [Schizopora paradoxa]|uniref:DUF6533 domain-containing protein n=1 Tax=Schizopora paradoxa TaxID=27342 RepID=A0A0H2RZX2_9AGAM|nr:hypothetical protein SCHPADRAFT_282963 [Schizopora paradoxa]
MASSSTDSIAVLASELTDTIAVKYFYLSNAVILYYDTLLNLREDVKYIWMSRWSLGKCLYILSRYLAFVDLTLLLVYTFDSRLRPSQCLPLYKASAWFQVAGVIFAELILIVRTYAIYQRSRPMLCYLIALHLGLTLPSLNIINRSFAFISYGPSPAPTIIPCVPTIGDVRWWIPFMCIAIFDLNIVTLTLWKAVMDWRSGATRTEFIITLYRDGFMYFAGMFATSLTNVILMKVMRQTPYFLLFVGWQRLLHALLSARLIINVRRASLGAWLNSTADPHCDTSKCIATTTTKLALSLDFTEPMELRYLPQYKDSEVSYHGEETNEPYAEKGV